MALSLFVLNPNILGRGLNGKQGSTAFIVLSLTAVHQHTHRLIHREKETEEGQHQDSLLTHLSF